MYGHGKVLRTLPPWRVLFLGTDEFALRILEALNADLTKGERTTPNKPTIVESLQVVTKKSKGAVYKFANDNPHLKHYIWPDTDIQNNQYDVGVVASFGKLIPEDFIKLFPYGILNVHPSLLPRWRGCAPVPYTLLAGDKVTGVTIQEIQPHRFDIGPVVNQRAITVPLGVTAVELLESLAHEGADLLLETLQNLSQLEDLEVDQNDRLATYAYKITSRDPRLLIDWSRETCRQIDKKFQAFDGLHDLRSYYGEYKVRLKGLLPRTELQWYSFRDQNMVGRPGSVAYLRNKDCLAIQCKDGLVGVQEVILKKTMSAKSFYNGYLSKPHWKYVTFSNKAEPGGPTKPSKVMSWRQRMIFQRYWHLQLLRMGALPSDG